ncbi:DUF5999 family protein [Kitasatospora sp. NPDC098663]|uniref:DUF5999 family protein n=1 Tax=Kitasatospora sp. NPDC098663 TaxID=3364096 RepID=UPI00381B3C92
MTVLNCQHEPNCPIPEAPDAAAAQIMMSHPEQGWMILCNGTLLFEDGGALSVLGEGAQPRYQRGTA